MGKGARVVGCEGGEAATHPSRRLDHSHCTAECGLKCVIRGVSLTLRRERHFCPLPLTPLALSLVGLLPFHGHYRSIPPANPLLPTSFLSHPFLSAVSQRIYRQTDMHTLTHVTGLHFDVFTLLTFILRYTYHHLRILFFLSAFLIFPEARTTLAALHTPPPIPSLPLSFLLLHFLCPSLSPSLHSL